ncbi:hypothetical protein [Micromonospora sp. WMMD1082]|uniref:hypothetical protein n=1 Tax=Micromonospora sp. WMMD1082 TaxID=3016104 RepID=UPI0024178277|nr:hypothetical protein [Micromonospora sp. WMMD1082]MDG4798669.1 hypothetical protein [Micromonospora sp. WMMD1082]
MTTREVFAVPLDDPDEDSPMRRLFEANRVLETHWTRALADPFAVGGCLECRGRAECAQLDWAIGVTAEIVAVMFQKG